MTKPFAPEPCPECNRQTSLMAGRVAFEAEPSTHGDCWWVCHACRQRARHIGRSILTWYAYQLPQIKKGRRHART